AVFTVIRRALAEDPNDASLRLRLERVADPARAHDQLARALEEELPRIAETKESAAVLLKLGELYELRLSAPAKAIDVLERARAKAVAGRGKGGEQDRALALPARGALARRYGQGGGSDRLVAVLDELEKVTPDVTERVGILFRLGQIAQDELEDEPRATDAFE